MNQYCLVERDVHVLTSYNISTSNNILNSKDFYFVIFFILTLQFTRGNEPRYLIIRVQLNEK